MVKFRQKQAEFVHMVALLILYVYEIVYEGMFGDV
jgi:hypothetical protein